MFERRPDYEEALAKSRDPETSNKELSQLLYDHHGEIEIAHAVARHPNLDSRTLANYLRFIPEVAAENPNVEKYREEDRNFDTIANRPPRVMCSEWSTDVSRSRPQIERLLWVMKNGKSAYQRDVMATEAIPEYVIREHVDSKNAALRKTFAMRKTLPDDLFEQLAKDRAKTVRAALAGNPHAPVKLIAKLAMDDEKTVAEAARNNPACPDEAIHAARLKDAANVETVDTGKMNLRDLAAHVAASDDENELRKFADHEDGCIRFLVGYNRRTPADVLEKIAADELDWVKAGAAFNPNTPVDALTKLMKSETEDVLIGLASNPSLTEEMQLELTKTEKDVVARTLANLTQHPSVWEVFASQAEPVKKKSERKWRNFIAEALKNDFVGMTQGMKSMMLATHRIAARSDKCPARLIKHYAFHLFDDYRHNAAASLALLEGKTHVHPQEYRDWKVNMWLSERRAPGHVANYYIQADDPKRQVQALSSQTTLLVYVLPFVTSKDTVTRKRVAERWDVNRFICELLIRDDKHGVREFVAKNKACPKDLLGQLHGDKETTVRNAARSRTKTARTEGSTVNQGSATERARLAKKTSDEKILAELAGDRATSVKRMVAKNYRTPQEALARLATDADEQVRIAVASKLQDKDIVRKLAADESPEVRKAAAIRNMVWRTRTPGNVEYDEDFLSFIAGSEDAELRAHAAHLTNQRELQERLFDDVKEVALQVARNPHFPTDRRLEIARSIDDQEMLGALAAKTDSEELFLLVADKITNPRADGPIRWHQDMLSRPAVQDKLCTHPCVNVRRALRNQRKLTRKARRALANDPDQKFRDETLKFFKHVVQGL
ncbi:MAG: hypothetical protein QNJ00_08180 [Woeseiaceae bacterium]|nr:hypothetical protein [Woeseiaceae bacterium]